MTILEMLDDIARDANLMHRRALLLELAKAATVRAGVECVEIGAAAVTGRTRDGAATGYACDTAVIAVGYRPRLEVFDTLGSLVPDFIAIGDCVQARKLLHAVRGGYDAGMAV